MIRQLTPYGLGIELSLPYAAAVANTREQLAREGFNVLTEVDVAATLRKKLGADFRPYIILGACNPGLAYQALSMERDVGLLLPCNVVVYAADEPGRSVVAVTDPMSHLERAETAEVRAMAHDARLKLERVLDALAALSPVS
ncbi:MAG TPA: DUF302 domain-containing protein [Gemmatimonadales bacterium]|nr:DUF302 domain-containing protein [Gemmatimonadales bacterium]